MASRVVSYALDDSTVVQFEIEPTGNFVPAGSDTIVAAMDAAVEPVMQMARVLIDKLRAAQPDQAEVTFGMKVSGTANWLVAKCATDANFEVRLSWTRPPVDGPS